ncbi:MAG TPA: hypothetical protein VM942_10085 [Acidimicrobiales bacterium]|nr:hypothetical protein [Acidimicrobiales bacterium]
MAKRTLLVSTALLAGLLAGCGGSASGSDGVATLSGADGSTTATTLSAADAEKVLLDWVTCMRGQGLDIADPSVDANGNLTLGGPRAGGAPGGGAAQGGDAGQGAAAPDRDAFQTAREECGDPPATSFGFNEEDRAAFQESALKLAQCMRKEGITDFADPDFSGAGPGGPGGGGGAGPGGVTGAEGGGGPFGDVDRTDPKVQAALTACRTQLGDAGVQLPGGARPGAAG